MKLTDKELEEKRRQDNLKVMSSYNMHPKNRTASKPLLNSNQGAKIISIDTARARKELKNA